MFMEHIWATAFGLSFVNPRKICEGTCLVKFLQFFHFNIKWRKDLLKRKDQKQVSNLKKCPSKFHNIQTPVTESFFQ